ncbi:MAG: PstS family phosphate ABC transporter substrate-binding protein [Prevotella sp.]|nr:PstS family phosphate ABC transporter substrate-binding protein [Prevotella sp.]
MNKTFHSILSIAVIVSLAIATVSCGGKKSEQQTADGELSGNISISGAFALYPLAVKWAEEFQKLHPEVKIEVDGGGAGKGMTDVLADQVDIAMVSREVSDEEAKKGAIGFPTAKDAVVPTINEKNPFYAQLVKHGITQQAATDIWINGTIKTWGQLLGTQDQTKIAVFTRSDACGAAETFAKWLGKHQEDLLGEGVNGDPGVATAVSKNTLSIGLNNIGYAYDNNTLKPLPGIRVLPVDSNNNGKIDPDEDFYASKDQITKAIAEGRYPSPPARDLYLVTKGLPTNPVVIAFLKYVLTDGQKLNAPVGYIEIPQEKLDKALAKLEKK